MTSNSNLSDREAYLGNWTRKENMEAYDRLPPDIRAAIAYADGEYSIEELHKDPYFRGMSREELLTFIWEHSDGFEIRYPHHVRVQYERSRAASYRDRYVRDWPLGRYGMEVFDGRDPFGPLRRS